MGRGGVGIVARAVKVDGHQVDTVETVLPPVRIEHDAQRPLGHAVRRVRFFGEAVPERFLAKRDRAVLGIGADRADLHELVDAAHAGLFDQVQTHGHVGEKEPAGVGLVRPDSADLGRQVNDDVGLVILEQSLGGIGPRQVILARSRHDDARRPAVP